MSARTFFLVSSIMLVIKSSIVIDSLDQFAANDSGPGEWRAKSTYLIQERLKKGRGFAEGQRCVARD